LLTIPDTLTRSAKSSTIPSFTKAGKLVGCPHIIQTRRKPHMKIDPESVCVFYKTLNVLAKQVICINWWATPYRKKKMHHW
jgi:hypothetical protein